MRPLSLFIALYTLTVFNGCSSQTHQPTQPAPKTPSFIIGQHDGCKTAQGEYTKDSERFQNDTEYHEGWFEGRRQCNPSFHK